MLEYVMLVDLVRNDLSRVCDEVEAHYIKRFSITPMSSIW